MTREKEALKLALKALKANHLLIHGSETKGGLSFCMDGYYSGCFDIDSNDKQTDEAITAIEEALAQPEQEPCDMGKMCIGCSPRNADGSCPDAQRKPLMDWEISNVYFDATGQGLRLQDKALAHKFARAIEAAHGIKE